jgi:hypothetical protein
MGKMGKIPKYKKKISGPKIRRMKCNRRKMKRIKGNQGRVKRLPGCPFKRVRCNICEERLGLVRGMLIYGMDKLERIKNFFQRVSKNFVHKTIQILRQGTFYFQGVKNEN